MRLLIASGDPTPASGDRGAFTQLLEEFARHWERIDVIVPPRKGAQDCTLFGNVHFHVGDRPRWRHPAFIKKRGRTLIEEHHHDLILSHDHGLFYDARTVLRLGRRHHIPVVSEIHHVMGYPRASGPMDHLRYWAARLYVRQAKKRVAAFRVVNAKSMPDLLRSWGVPPAKIEVMYSFYLDHEIFRPMPAEKRYDAIYCGRLARNKGIELILGAARKLAHFRPGFRILLLGRGELEEQIRTQVGQLGLTKNVEMIRWVEGPEDVARLYNESRLSVCASYHEGGPRVTLEAMACGLPVVSTPVGVMTEVIHEGENGCFAEWNAEDLAAKMERILSDPEQAKTMGARAEESVRRFDKETIIRANAERYKTFAHRFHEKGDDHE